MENKKFKQFTKSDPSLSTFFFKAHQIPKKEKEQSAALNFAFRQLKDEKGIHGVTAIFRHLPSQKLAQFEEKNPLTAKRLFQVAKRLIAGEHGPLAQDKAQQIHADLFERSTLQKLLVLDYLTQESEMPEVLAKAPDFAKKIKQLTPEQKNTWIFSKDSLDIPWTSEENLAIEQLLRKNLAHLTNPSHLSVNLLIENNEPIEKSIKVFEQLKNSTEKSKSLANIVQQLIHKNKFDRALETVKSIKVDRIKTKPIVKVIDNLLNPSRPQFEKILLANQVDQALKLAQTIDNKTERNKVYQKIAQDLVKNHQLDMAKKVVLLISDEENREYVLSTLVSTLANIHDFQPAIHIAQQLTDPDYRVDAYSYIVKSFLDSKEIDQAIAFVESIKNAHERSKIAKILLSSMIAQHDPDRIVQIREKFELSRQYHGSNL